MADTTKSDNKPVIGAISVKMKAVKTRNFLILAGIGIAIIGIIVMTNRKAQITKIVVTEI